LTLSGDDRITELSMLRRVSAFSWVVLGLGLLPQCKGDDPGDTTQGGTAGSSSSESSDSETAGETSSQSSSGEPTGESGSSESTTSTAETTEETGTTGEPTSESSAGSTDDSGSASEESTGEPSGTPPLLSQTGLFSDIETETLGEGVHEYSPQFELWSDTAAKRRWFFLPEGTQIDTSDMNDWEFPVGTRIWKEFSRDGVRIETRMIEKLPPERFLEGWDYWLMVTYVWNEAQTDAEVTADGLANAKGTEHDVPDAATCNECHDARDEKPLGVSAIQLSHDGPGMNLTTMIADGMLSDPPQAAFVVPGTEDERAVLGYLHANCGHCHREGSPANDRVPDLTMWMDTDRLTSVTETQAYTSLVNAVANSDDGTQLCYRIHGGAPEESEIIRRTSMRGESQMPAVGSELVDDDAVMMLTTWIESLPGPTEPPPEYVDRCNE